ncbi:hypothetical protein PCH70_28830 [Pseudomonas cichorii JBC1]|nr:hypothetical protein PCH70_28830 [Pseudomonas cichorii JBC1]
MQGVILSLCKSNMTGRAMEEVFLLRRKPRFTGLSGKFSGAFNNR